MNSDFVWDGVPFDALADSMVKVAETLHLSVFPAIEIDFRRLSAERFEAQGPGWASLQPATVAAKKRRGMPQPERILFGWGTLAESMGGRNGFTITETTIDSIFMGTSVPYARYHQEGGGRLPARPIVDITEMDVARWGYIIQASFDVL